MPGSTGPLMDPIAYWPVVPVVGSKPPMMGSVLLPSKNEPAPVTNSMPVQVSVPAGPLQLTLKPTVSASTVVLALMVRSKFAPAEVMVWAGSTQTCAGLTACAADAGISMLLMTIRAARIPNIPLNFLSNLFN